MKKKLKLIVFTILLIAISLLLSNKADALTINRKNSLITEGFDLSDNHNGVYKYFCIDDAYAYTWMTAADVKKGDFTYTAVIGGNFANYQMNTKVNYEPVSSTNDISPNVGYAYWYLQQTGQLGTAYADQDNSTHKSLGRSIYNSDAMYDDNMGLPVKSSLKHPFTNEMMKRADKYAKCYYEIFSKVGNNMLFTPYADDFDLAVNVDQNTGKMTVGPYYLQLSVDASTEAQNYLYNEIIRNGVSDNIAFATFKEIRNINGTNPIFVNKAGKQIKFPNFVSKERFYIQFTPADNGYITEVAKLHPEIVVDYIKKFNGTATKYIDKSSTWSNFYMTLPSLRGDQDISEADHWMVEGPYQDGEATENGVNYKAYFYVRVWVTFHTTWAFNKSCFNYQQKRKIDFKEDGQWLKVEYNLRLGKGSTYHDYKNDTYTMVDKDGDGIKETKINNHDGYDHGWKPNSDAIAASKKQDNYQMGRTVKDHKDQLDFHYGEYTLDASNCLQPLVEINLGGGVTLGHASSAGAVWTRDITALPNKEINMLIQGTVWKDMPDATKEYTVNGRNDRVIGDGQLNGQSAVDMVFPGVEVSLYELQMSGGSISNNPVLVATTTTDKNGKYYFYGKRNASQPLMNPMYKYFVVFKYNGQLYQMTYYRNKLAKDSNEGYSNAKEAIDKADYGMEITRNTINARFSTISPTSYNYSGGKGHQAFAYNGEIRNEDGSLVGEQYRDAWKRFISENTFKGQDVWEPVKEDYNKVWNRQQTYNYNVSTTAVNNFIEDSMLTAKSYQVGDESTLFPVYRTYQIESLDETSNKCNQTKIVVDWGAIAKLDGAWTTTTSRKPVVTTKTTSVGTGAVINAETLRNIAKSYSKGEHVPYDQILALNSKTTTTSTVTGYTTVTSRTWSGKYNFSDYCIPTYIPGETDNEQIGSTKYYYVYTIRSNQAYYANFGVTWREEPEMYIYKDLYKATVIVNGKYQPYYYNKTASQNTEMVNGTWTIKMQAGNAMFDASQGSTYDREIYKSDYAATYTGNEAGKNLQVMATYRITLVNTGNVKMRVNELVDYYDAKNYSFDAQVGTDAHSDGQLTPREYKSYAYDNGEGTSYTSAGPSTYLGKDTGAGDDEGRQGSINVYGSSQTYIGNNPSEKKETISGDGFNYSTLYLTGIKTSTGSEWFNPGDVGYVYITFRVNTDESSNGNHKIILDENWDGSMGKENGQPGKRNIIEINSYSTKYVDNATVPDTLDDSNGRHDRAVGNQDAGLIDKSSNPGNLSAGDLEPGTGYLRNEVENKEYTDEFGTSRTDDSSGHKIENGRYKYREPDTAEAKPFRIIINKGADTEIKGYVFEDNRTVDKSNAIIGDGISKDDEAKISGVTIDLVELVTDVDENGVAVGTYNSERVLGEYKVDNRAVFQSVNNNADHYSAKDNPGANDGSSFIVWQGDGIFHVDPTSLTKGYYSIKSIPAGNYYVRFTYGDKTRTVLTNGNDDFTGEYTRSVDGQGNAVKGTTYKDVNAALAKATNKASVTDTTGWNNKSYNGQDYKSTVYQKNISPDSTYFGVSGYKDVNKQNYTVDDGITAMEIGKNDNGNYKSMMYNYDINNSAAQQGASDAKDVYAYRQAQINYSKDNVTNYKAEVLSSFEKLGTYVPRNADGSVNEVEQGNLQAAMVTELMQHTKQVAQTGQIRLEIEYNRTSSGNRDGSDGNDAQVTGAQYQQNGYLLDDVDLGLVERPRAQMKLNKEITNFKLSLASGDVLFDTTQSVNNLYYAKHEGHSIVQENGRFDWSNRVSDTINHQDGKVTQNPSNVFRLRGAKVSSNSSAKPELLQAYIDDELLEGSRIEVTYTFKVENVGEVDYLSKDFYYKGNPGGEVSKTSANTVIDYVSNEVRYDDEYNADHKWDVKDPSQLVTGNNQSDLVNRTYGETIKTYNTLLTTDSMGGALAPEVYDGNKGNSYQMVVTTQISTNTSGENLVYNNLAEIVRVSNSQGRRMQFSTVGNQPMADQSLGNNARSDLLTKVTLVTPTEIDADSAQRIVLMPPTGENRNYLPYILATLVSAGLIIAAVIIIKRKVIGSKK